MSDITPESVFEKNPRIAYRTVNGAALIVIPRDAKMLKLNEVGTRVWELLEARTAKEIAEQLSQEFQVTEAEALADTSEFLKELRERGAVIEKTERP